MARATLPAAMRATFELFAVLMMTAAAEQLLEDAGKAAHPKNIIAELVVSRKKSRAREPEASVWMALAKDSHSKNTGRNVWVVV